ncbi:MAG: hypothetical protein NC037_03475 [Bacteroides sp.]|nr:hypothetical protein [Bacteroides sp.]
MRMEYRLLDSGKGVMLTRQPELVSGDLYITFTGAPAGATAIFENGNGDSVYRLLSDGSCGVPASFLAGNVRVVVTLLDGTANAPKWACEGIKTTATNGGVLVCPNDGDIPRQIAEMAVEMQGIRTDIKTLFDKYSGLETILNKLLEGYDVT